MRLYGLTLLCCLLLFSGCDPTRMHDSDLGLTRGQYEKLLSKDALPSEKKDVTHPPIPRLSKIVAMPPVPKIYDEKLISISATDDIPVVDLLLEIGRVANIDIVIDKNITGGLFINMKNAPLLEVFDKIADMADLRYTENNGSFTFEYDDPCLHTYNVNFLNIIRTGSSSMSTSTSVVSGSLSSGSSSSLGSSMTDSFWADMMIDIQNIMTSSRSVSRLKRYGTAQGTAVTATDNSANQSNTPATNSSTATAGASTTGAAAGAAGTNVNISLNKTAGTLNIFTNSRGNKQIAQYLEVLRKKVTAQVLIEVKIAEVALTKQFATGVDFSLLNEKLNVGTQSLSQLSSATFKLSTSQTNSQGDAMTGLLNLLDTFGTTKILASPRLTAINNQPAVMTFADNEVYFNISVVTTPAVLSGTGANIISSQVSLTSAPQTIPVGIVLTLQPSIDLDNNTTLLSVRPTLSRIKEMISDPGFDFLTQQNKLTNVPANKIPVTSVRELDSIANMRNGDIMIMGGFTEKSTSISESGVPFFSRIPLIGWLFSKTSKTDSTLEVIILIKTTIITDKTEIPEYDKMFYKSFFNDPREFDF